MSHLSVFSGKLSNYLKGTLFKRWWLALSLVACVLLVACESETTLTIFTVPDNATVSIKDSTHIAPINEFIVEPGVIDVEVSHVGYLPKRVFVDVMKGDDNRYTIKLDTEREVDAEHKPILTNEGFRIRTVPEASDATCLISSIVTGETHTFDLEETPITGDWTKIMPLAGFNENTNFVDIVGLAVCSDNGDYGVCSLGSLTDAMLKLEEVEWMDSRPFWSYPRAREFDDDISLTTFQEGSCQLINDNKVVSTYKGNVAFHGRKTDKTTIWNYITTEGRQKVVELDGDSVKPIWEGKWALGAFNHVDGEASPIDFIDEQTIATVICSSTGYKLVVIDLSDNKILSQHNIDVFPKNLSVVQYDDVFGINLEYRDLVCNTYTWTRELGFASNPEVANGDFTAIIGTWLPAGSNRFELRFPGDSNLSVCFRLQEDELVAVWAGSVD